MERRVLFTLIACLLFTLMYWKMFPPAPRPEAGPGAGRPDAAGTVPAVPDGAAAPGPTEGAGAAPVVEGGFEQTAAGPIEIAPFESDDLVVEFTNQGAAITQVYLKKYYDTAAARDAEQNGREHWVSLFPGAESSFGDALTLRELTTGTSAARYHLERVCWEVAADDTDANGRREIRFVYRTRDGLEFLKRISCRPDEHFVRVAVGVRSLDEQAGGGFKEFLLRAAGGIRDVDRGWFTLDPEGVAMRVTQRGEPDMDRFSAKKLAGSPETVVGQGETKVAWGGVTNLYFSAVLAPDVPGAATVVDLRSANGEVKEKIQAELVVPLPVGKGELKEIGFRLYVGPKDKRLLEEQDLATFHQLIEEDYGAWESFRWINKLLLLILHFFHGFTHNWGVAIILLTLLVRMCIFPITRTQQVSMQRYSQKMAVLKPKLDELKEKFKDKPQKFAQEQMKLLKEHNAKPPVLGCLSTFITFPVFIGMFQILRTAIELRQAPFAGWIDDLSLPDSMFVIPGTHYYFNLLPILATAAFVTQMALAPKPADPQARQQQKIMLIMPLVFGVMFYGYAAGLSLYMLTSSLYGIIEYKFIRQKFFPAPAPPAPVAAGRGSR